MATVRLWILTVIFVHFAAENNIKTKNLTGIRIT